MTAYNGEAGDRPARLVKSFEQMYTRFIIDPLAEPTARWLARYEWITPNRITAVAGVLGLGSASFFAAGLLPLAGALFLLRFFVDCLDGKVARAQNRSTNRGAALDLTMDVSGILLSFAGLAWYLIRMEQFPILAAVLLLAFVGMFNWLLQYRKQLAERLGVGTGGANREWRSNLPVLGAYTRWCARKEMNPLPYAVEMETLALGLLPLMNWSPAAAAGLYLALAFYFMACLVNARRVWRVAGNLDEMEAPRRNEEGVQR